MKAQRFAFTSLQDLIYYIQLKLTTCLMSHVGLLKRHGVLDKSCLSYIKSPKKCTCACVCVARLNRTPDVTNAHR